MFRPVVLCGLLTFAVPGFVAGCAASSSEADGNDPQELVSDAAPVVLVATDDFVRARCASELAATYCSRSSAQSAQSACEARLSEKERSSCADGICVTQFSAAREGSGCREGATYDPISTCRQPAYDSCAFYRSCLETARPCGETGYALGFGERFCNVFLRRVDDFTPAGQAWLHEIRHCLQNELVHDLDDRPSCSALSDEAFISHSRCYTAPSNSICDQGARDIAALLKLVEFEPGQHLFKQLTAIVRACTVGQLSSRSPN